MTYREYLDSLANPAPCYLLFGEESYLKRHCLTSAREKLLGGQLNGMNHAYIDAAATPNWLMNFAEAVTTLPMFGGPKLVELHSVNWGKLNEDSFVEVCTTFENIDPSCTVIIYTTPDEFSAGTEKAPTKLLQRLQKAAVCVRLDYESPERLAAWIGRHFTASDVPVTPKFCRTLVEYCGVGMEHLANEAAKLVAYYKYTAATYLSPPVGGVAQSTGVVSSLTEAHIIDICCPVGFHGDFDFANALRERRTSDAYVLMNEMITRKERPEIILSSIIDVVGNLYYVSILSEQRKSKEQISADLKLHSYRTGLFLSALRTWRDADLPALVAACLDADIKIKSVPIDPYGVLVRLLMQCGSQGWSVRV